MHVLHLQWVDLWMALCFIAANQSQPAYDSYHNICYLRDPAMQPAVCQLPASLNTTKYLAAQQEWDWSAPFEQDPRCMLNEDTTLCVRPSCNFRVSAHACPPQLVHLGGSGMPLAHPPAHLSPRICRVSPFG